MPRRTAASLSLVLAIAAAPGGAQSATRAETVGRLDSLAGTMVRSGETPGLSIAVVRGRDTLLMKGYGTADVESGAPAEARTVYRIGSITKQFTAAAIMQLVEQGKIGLDDRLAKYVPSAPAAWHPVTVRQLLNHTSGIRSYTNIGTEWQARWTEDMPPDTILALVRDDTLDFAPGTSWSYNNTGYVLLGMILEKVTGRPYADELQERFFTPLGLTSTYYCGTRPHSPRVARGYTPGDGKFVDAPELSMTQPFSAGALCSTVGDLVRWNRALAEGRVVSPASLKLMTTPEGGARSAPLNYGYGLAVDTLAGHAMVTHGGGIHGFISANAFFPDDSLTVVVLTNAAPGNPDALLRNAARVALGAPLAPVRAAVTLTAQERARYVGTYEVNLPDRKLPMRIFEQGEQLVGHAEGQQPIPLIAHGNHVFGAAFDPGLRLTFTVSGDQATKFTLAQGGGTFEAPRVR